MRIGCVPYLNAKPLVVNLKHPIRYEVPSKLEQLILDNHLDIALVSSITFLQNPFLYLIPQGGIIGSDGVVDSVCLFLKKNITVSTMKSIYFTTESRTSVALFKILWRHFWKKAEPIIIDQSDSADGKMIIGDQALFFDNDQYTKVDLGLAWQKLTQRPFVYAVWASRQKPTPEIQKLFLSTYEARKLLIPQIASTSLHPDKVTHYLTKNIQYEMTNEHIKGLETFRDFCLNESLIDVKRDIYL